MRSSPDSSDTSISSSFSSSARIFGNRWSSSAALAAHRTMLWPSVSLPSITPIQPCSRPATCKVTNTPHRRSSVSVRGISRTGRFRQTASSTAWRASSRMALRSASERHGILRFFLRLHHPQFMALLDSVVQLIPESVKILRRGNHGADHHQPQQQQTQFLHPFVASPRNQYRRGAHLQHHLGLPERRCRDRESFRRRNVSQPENHQFPPDDYHHHPCLRQVHVHQRNERRANQKFVGYRVQQYAQGRDLPVPSCEIPVGPVRSRRDQQNQHAPDFKVHLQAPQLHVRAARQQNYDQQGNDKYPQERQCIRQVHGSVTARPFWCSRLPLASL